MKRRLILGLSLLAFVLIVFSVFVIHNLLARTQLQRLQHQHQLILNDYLQVMNKLQDMQLNLYRYEGGDIGQANKIVNNIFFSENILAEINSSYDKLKTTDTCNTCHFAESKINNINTVLFKSIQNFKNYANTIIVKRSSSSLKKAKEEAMREGTEGQARIDNFWDKMIKMDLMLQDFIVQMQIRFSYIIIIGISVYIFISVIILITMIRSITTPFKKLIQGIEKASSGDLNLKVDVGSDDEMGFIAIAFNNMLDNLNKAMSENKNLISELQVINKTLEQRIAKKIDELKIVHDKMIRMESIAIAGTLAFGVAHELSTPLSTLMGYCDLINKKIPDEYGVKKYCNLLEKEIDRCMDILTGMLDFAKIPNDQKELTDINSTLTDMLLLISLQKNYKNVSVIENMDPALPQIMANPSGLRQVFMNIIINALQAMPEGGELTISTSVLEEERKIMVSIGDTGHGIPENDINKIFTSFYTTKKTGTGLGLSISHGIIKGHDGFITVKSEKGKGSNFNIFLPISVKNEALVK